MRHRRIVLLIVVVLGLTAGCGTPSEPSRSTTAGDLVAAAAKKLRQLDSVTFDFSINGTIPGFRIRTASGALLPDGTATGTIDLQHGREHTEYEFTIDGTTLRLTDDGSSKTRTLPQQYTPAHLLRSAEGIRLLLREANGLHIETTESLHGVSTFRLTGKLDQATLGRLVPGVWADAVVKFWISKGPSHTLQRVWVQLPPRRPKAGVVALELSLSRYNAVSRPTSTNPTTTSGAATSAAATPTSSSATSASTG